MIMLPCFGQQPVGHGRKVKVSADTALTKKTTQDGTKGSVEPYERVITDKAVTQKGMINVHKIDEKYYWEIPDSLLGRELLLVSRIAKSPGQVSGMGEYGDSGGGYYAGDEVDEREIEFEKGPNDKIFVRGISHTIHAGDTSGNGLLRSVAKSNVQPIIADFPIKAYNKIWPASVIDVTGIFVDEQSIFSFSQNEKIALRLTALARDRSYTEYIKTFPGNVEIRTVKTYLPTPPSSDPLTFEMNNSLVLLPKVPMLARLADSRVGFLSTGFVDFDANPQGVGKTYYLARWRLEPKDEDTSRYFRGELVEPKKKIVFYIDPTTPRKWIPYLAQGVNDWNCAFEKAGFKNAIEAKEAPLDDSTWSIEDASHSAIVYKPSSVANAEGPSIKDPRSGEILESHINWYHNVMSLIHNWYMIQAGAIDPRARKMVFDDELMGQLIRFVSSHEVGHALGLMHNFGASSTVPVDSLRSKRWVEAHGHTPSIMDYARFNYVAQPEDNVSEAGVFPRINDYDKWAIEFGYRLFRGIKTPKDEEAFLNKWIIDSLSHNHRLWYGPQSLFVAFDPRCQNEDLGDNAMKASNYGIENLKRILPHLPEWTRKPNDGYGDLKAMYKELVSQYSRYATHVTTNIGGYYLEVKTVEQKGDLYTPVPKKIQRQAMEWLNRQVFTKPAWLDNQIITSKVESFVSGSTVTETGTKLLSNLMSNLRMNLLVKTTNRYGSRDVYTLEEFLQHLKQSLWAELWTHKAIDPYRRALQNTYVDILSRIVKPGEPKGAAAIGQAIEMSQMQAPTSSAELLIVIHPNLVALKKEIQASIASFPDEASRAHLKLMADKISQAMDPKL